MNRLNCGYRLKSNVNASYKSSVLNIARCMFFVSTLQTPEFKFQYSIKRLAHWSTEAYRFLAKRLGFSNGTHRLLEQCRIGDSQIRYMYETYLY